MPHHLELAVEPVTLSDMTAPVPWIRTIVDETIGAGFGINHGIDEAQIVRAVLERDDRIRIFQQRTYPSATRNCNPKIALSQNT